MARALILALGLGSAYGFGGTQRNECERVTTFSAEDDYSEDCNALGEACESEFGELGLCIQIIWADTVDGIPVSTSA